MPDSLETKWLKTLLFDSFSQVDNPQITDKSRYKTGDNWISYGALVYAIAVALRGNGIYPIGFEQIVSAEEYLKKKLAVPESDVRCWARHWEKCKTEMPWQAWEDGTFDFMESKATTEPNGWNWTDLSFCVSELHPIWPEANVFAMGQHAKLSELDEAQITATEAAFIIAIERCISHEEIVHAMREYPTGGLSKPVQVDRAIDAILDKALAGEIAVQGTPSQALNSFGKPRYTGRTETLPRETFGQQRSFSLSQNCLNPNGGRTGFEREYSDLSVLVSDLQTHFSNGDGSTPKLSVPKLQRGRKPREREAARTAVLDIYGSVGKHDPWKEMTFRVNEWLKANHTTCKSVSQQTVERAVKSSS